MWEKSRSARIQKRLKTLWDEVRVQRRMMRSTVRNSEELVRDGIDQPAIFFLCLAQRKQNEEAFRLQLFRRCELEGQIKKLIRKLIPLKRREQQRLA